MESSCECGDEPSGSKKAGKLLSGCTTGGLLSSAQLHRERGRGDTHTPTYRSSHGIARVSEI
jgi:hypothetical protein